MKAQNMRKKYPKFIYENYSSKISNNNLEIFFEFSIPPEIRFQPKIVIENINKKRLAQISRPTLDNLIFNLGMIEIPSYWKATCSSKIEIKAGCLNTEQIKWWENLIIKGMGQFFYENKINWHAPNFLKIVPLGSSRQDLIGVGPLSNLRYGEKLKNRYLVPFAGGRDSIVTLERLKKQSPDDISLFTVNPIEKIQKTAKVSGIKRQIIVKRIIDKKLLGLNKKGYLNGHTPFTSVLSFISVLCAVIFDYKNIAFSNEKSSDEGNVRYLGKTINHQWAKSSEFEEMFQSYCNRYLAKNIRYFSYLRNYGELEISKMLTKYPEYFPVFSSCNAGMKIGSRGNLLAKRRWCGNCPKCLFVYMTLYPFLNKNELDMIFGKDIFKNKRLLPVMKGLLEKGSVKPFECVGTKRESRKALELCLEKAEREGKIPFLLRQ